LREIAKGERADGRRVGYRTTEIEGQMYIWNEEEHRIVKRRNFCSRGRIVMEDIEEGTEGDGKKEGEVKEARRVASTRGQ